MKEHEHIKSKDDECHNEYEKSENVQDVNNGPKNTKVDIETQVKPNIVSENSEGQGVSKHTAKDIDDESNNMKKKDNPP